MPSASQEGFSFEKLCHTREKQDGGNPNPEEIKGSSTTSSFVAMKHLIFNGKHPENPKSPPPKVKNP